MKKVRIVAYLVFIGLLIMAGMASAQVDISPPILKNASVINEKGDVRLTWELTDTVNADLSVKRDSLNINAFTGIHLIQDTSKTTWVDSSSGANSKTRSYKLAYNLEGPGVRQSNEFNTIHTKIDHDICNKENQLIWSRRVIPPESKWLNFFNNLQFLIFDQVYIYLTTSQSLIFNDDIKEMSSWNIYRSEDGNHYTKIDSNLVADDTTFTDHNIEYNHTYKYYIEGVRKDYPGISTKSNRVIIDTEMPEDPEFIHFDKLETKERRIDLKFTIDGNSDLERYVLLRSESLSGPYDTVETFNTRYNKISYTDESVNPQDEVHYYHMASVNSCGTLTTRSDTLSNLLLNVEKQNLNSILEWNEMGRFSNISYKIYRQIGKQVFRSLQTSFQSPYTDNEIETYKGQDTSSKFCYQIKAEIKHDEGIVSTVTSNSECVYIKPQIFIPNAIIPNANNKNNAFKPEFTFIPENYLLIVYNRDGTKVFESRDYQKPWKGRRKGGKKVPGGTYMYYLEVKNPGKKVIRKKGEVTVVYQK